MSTWMLGVSEGIVNGYLYCEDVVKAGEGKRNIVRVKGNFGSDCGRG